MLTHLDSSSLTALDLISSDGSLCCPMSTALSVVRRQLLSSSAFVQLPSRIPLPTSGHARSRVQTLCLVSRQNNGIVYLADLLHSVTFTRPLISKSSSPSTNNLVTVPRAPITIGVTVTFMFHSFFNSLDYEVFSVTYKQTISVC